MEEVVMDAELNTEVTTEQTDHIAMNADGTADVQKPPTEKEIKDFKIAYAKALKERQLTIKKNKELIADKQLEVSFWKAEADLMRYRFEKMDFFIKSLDLEPAYLLAVEKVKARDAQNVVGNSKPILD